MASIIFPKRWSQKPPPGQAINWSHPLAVGLGFLVLPDGQRQHEYVSGARGALLTSGNWTSSTPNGNAVGSTSTANGGAYWAFPNALQGLSKNYTFLFRGRLTSVVDYSALIAIPYRASGWSNPFNACSLVKTPTAAPTQAHFLYSDAGQTQYNTSSGTNFQSTSDPVTTYAATRNGAAVVFYRNGLRHSTADYATNNPVDVSNAQPVTLMNHSSTSNGEGAVGVCDMAAIWTRTLTPLEMEWLQVEPYAMLMPQTPRLRYWYMPAAGPIAHTLVGQTDGLATATGALAANKALASQADGQATVAGALTKGLNLAGQADGLATSSGAVQAGYALAATAQGIATVVGELTVTSPSGNAWALDGTAAASSTATGSLSVGRPLAGIASGASTAEAALTKTLNLEAIAAGTGAVTAALTKALNLDGLSAGSGDANASLTKQLNLGGLSAALGAAEATLQQSHALSEAIGAVSDVTGSLALGVALAAQSDGVGNVVAELSAKTPVAYQLGANMTPASTMREKRATMTPASTMREVR